MPRSRCFPRCTRALEEEAASSWVSVLFGLISFLRLDSPLLDIDVANSVQIYVREHHALVLGRIRV